MILVLLLGFIVIVVIAILGNDVEGMRSTMQKINKNYENRKFLLISRCGGEYLLITENNTIVYGKYNGIMKEIQIDDVMKIDIEYNIREKNTKRILTVVPTFEKTTSLTGVIVNILTFSNDDFSNEFNVNSYEVDVRLQIDKFKYIVEEIKNKNEIKNN